MTFKRSPKGLENSRRFKSADLIVYTEGDFDQALTKDLILAGDGKSDTNDCKFWGGLFGIFCPQLRVRVVSVGNCTVAESIANDIVSHNLVGICVAFDRDYKDFWGPNFEDDRVVLSRRYSWESDLLDKEVILSALDFLMFAPYDRVAVGSVIESCIERLNKKLKLPIRCDQVLVSAGYQLFDRKKPASFLFDTRLKSLPDIDLSRIRADICKKKQAARGVFLVNRSLAVNGLDHGYGKLLCAFARRLTRYLINELGQTPPSDDYVDHFLLRAFHVVVESGRSVAVQLYYGRCISAAAARAIGA